MVRSVLSVCLLSLSLNCRWTWSNLLLWCGPFSLKWLPPPPLVIKRQWETGGTTSSTRPDSTWPGVTTVFTHPHTYHTGRGSHSMTFRRLIWIFLDLDCPWTICDGDIQSCFGHFCVKIFPVWDIVSMSLLVKISSLVSWKLSDWFTSWLILQVWISSK